MTSNPHLYQVEVAWTDRRAGRVVSDDFPILHVAAPPEFSGDAGVWTPEHLLAAATASCLMITFLAVAEASKLSVTSYRSRAIARLEKVPGEGYRFTEITVAPEIAIAAEDLEKAQKAMVKAEKSCFIANSLRAALHVEPRFLVAAMAR